MLPCLSLICSCTLISEFTISYGACFHYCKQLLDEMYALVLGPPAPHEAVSEQAEPVASGSAGDSHPVTTTTPPSMTMDYDAESSSQKQDINWSASSNQRLHDSPLSKVSSTVMQMQDEKVHISNDLNISTNSQTYTVSTKNDLIMSSCSKSSISSSPALERTSKSGDESPMVVVQHPTSVASH